MIDPERLGLSEGARFAFRHRITAAEVDAFARLSGDANRLHMDHEYARQQGHRDRVVHGALLAALVSRLIGMELPVRRTLLLGLNLHFVAPTYPEDVIEVAGVVASVHPAADVVTLKLTLTCGDELRARGTAMVRVGAEA